MSSSSYVRTTYICPDAGPSETSQTTTVYLNANLCNHSSTICATCISQWLEEYDISFTTHGGRRFLEKYPSFSQRRQ